MSCYLIKVMFLQLFLYSLFCSECIFHIMFSQRLFLKFKHFWGFFPSKPKSSSSSLSKSQVLDICSVLVTVLLLWRETVTKATYGWRHLISDWWLAYSFRGWTHEHHRGEHGIRQSGMMLEKYLKVYICSTNRSQPPRERQSDRGRERQKDRERYKERRWKKEKQRDRVLDFLPVTYNDLTFFQ